MKKLKQHILLSLLIIMITLTSCFEERDDDFTVVGGVATIPVLTLSKPNPVVAVVGEQITVNFRYYSERVPVNELRLMETIGTGTATVVQTKSISGFDIKNSYNDSFTYTVPSVAAGTKITLTVGVQTENELMNSRTSPTITVN